MGIKEKKEIRGIEEFIESEGLGSMRTACGNDALGFALEVDESLTFEQIDKGGNNVKEVVDAFVDTCKDEDYKEELAKLEKITVEVKPDFTEKNMEAYCYGFAKLDGSNLVVSIDGCHSYSNGNSDAGMKVIKDLY